MHSRGFCSIWSYIEAIWGHPISDSPGAIVGYRGHVGPPKGYLRPSRRHVGVMLRHPRATWSILGHLGCVCSRPACSRCCFSLELFASTRLWTKGPGRCSRLGSSMCILEKRECLNRLRSNLVLPRGVSDASGQKAQADVLESEAPCVYTKRESVSTDCVRI